MNTREEGVPDITDQPEAFWSIDLRLGVLRSWRAKLSTDARWTLGNVARLFPAKRHLDALCAAIGVSATGKVEDVQQRVAEVGVDLLPWMLVAQYAARKNTRAVEDVIRLALGEAELAALRGPRELDRVVGLLALARRRPDTLPWVRALHHWHSKGMARLAVPSGVGSGRAPFIAAMSPAAIQEALAQVRTPPDAPRPQFEMVVPLADGSSLFVVRRNHRPNLSWDDNGERLHHGHDEELIVLHFAEDGRSVGVSGTTIELPRQLAEAVASTWFGEALRLVDVVETAKPASVKRMLTALATGQVPELALLEMGARNTPFAGCPEITLKVAEDLGRTLDDFASVGRPIGMVPEDVMFIRVRFGARVVHIDFPKKGDDVIVRFTDGRLDKDEARALQELLDRHFAIKPVSSEAKVA